MSCQQMDFPETFDEFAESYGFRDKEEIYTNGAELIPIFRVKQWLQHIEKKSRKNITCTCTNKEIAKSFIEDVEKVKDLLPCEDCVRRDVLLNQFCTISPAETYFVSEIVQVIKELPSVQPARIHAKWIHGICSNCKYDWGKDAPIASVPNYCPNCGADMRGNEND